MKGKTLLVTGLAALVLAACSGTPAVEWSLPVSSIPFSCAYDPDKISQMDAEIDKHRDTQRGGNLSDKWLKEEEKVKQLQILARQTANLANGVTFNVADGIENVFDYYMDSIGSKPDVEMKSRFVCDKVEVFNSEGYAVVIGRDKAHPTVPPYNVELPFSVAYVLKVQPSGIELAGFIPNYGHHMFAQVVRDYPGLGDLLILGSRVNPDDGENGLMLDAAAREFDFKNYYAASTILQRGAKVTIHKIGQTGFEKIASRPLYFGRDVAPEEMKLIEEGGKLKLYLSVSVETPVGDRYNVKSGTFDIGQLVADGIIPTAPLFRR